MDGSLTDQLTYAIILGWTNVSSSAGQLGRGALDLIKGIFSRGGAILGSAGTGVQRGCKNTPKTIDGTKTGWCLPDKGGAMINGRWYTEHALERMAPRTPEVMAKLEARALQRAMAEGHSPGTREFAKWMASNGPAPRNIPSFLVEAEVANPGCTSMRVILSESGSVITVIPR